MHRGGNIECIMDRSYDRGPTHLWVPLGHQTWGPPPCDIWWWSLEICSSLFIWGGHWNWSTYGFQAGGTHHTGMLSCRFRVAFAKCKCTLTCNWPVAPMVTVGAASCTVCACVPCAAASCSVCACVAGTASWTCCCAGCCCCCFPAVVSVWFITCCRKK